MQIQKLKTLQTKLKKVEKMNREKCNKCQISIKFESLKPYAVLYMQDSVAYFETIIQIKYVFCMQVYLDNALLMK